MSGRGAVRPVAPTPGATPPPPTDVVEPMQHGRSFLASDAALHRLPDDDGFAGRLRRAQLEWLATSESAARSLAGNYVGLPFS